MIILRVVLVGLVIIEFQHWKGHAGKRIAHFDSDRVIGAEAARTHELRSLALARLGETEAALAELDRAEALVGTAEWESGLAHVRLGRAVVLGENGQWMLALAEALGVDQTTATRMLALIKKAGLASDTVGDDRRQRRWALSAQGQALQKKLKPRWKAAQEAFEKRLGRAEAAALKKASYLAASRLSSTQTVHA